MLLQVSTAVPACRLQHKCMTSNSSITPQQAKQQQQVQVSVLAQLGPAKHRLVVVDSQAVGVLGLSALFALSQCSCLLLSH